MSKFQNPMTLKLQVKENKNQKSNLLSQKSSNNTKGNRDFINSLFIDSNRLTRNLENVTQSSFKMIDIYKQTFSSDESDNAQRRQKEKVSQLKRFKEKPKIQKQSSIEIKNQNNSDFK